MFRTTQKKGSLTFQHQQAHKELGAALVELAIVLPVLILLFVGITELGRAFSARAKFDSSSYWAALTGAGVATTVRTDVMQATFAKLNGINTAGGSIDAVSFAPDLSIPGIVSAVASGTMRVVTNSTALGLHSGYTIIDLVPPPSNADLTKFGNSGYYDCNGVPVSSPLSSCAPPNDGGGTGGSSSSGGVNCGGRPCVDGGTGGPSDGGFCPAGPILQACNF